MVKRQSGSTLREVAAWPASACLPGCETWVAVAVPLVGLTFAAVLLILTPMKETRLG